MMELDETDSLWYAYEGGITEGQPGETGGKIIRDEELGDPDDPEFADARLTLEQGTAEKQGYYLTATLYGWMFHTCRRETEPAATTDYEAMKAELTRLAGMLPFEEDGTRRIEEKTEWLNTAIVAFEERFA